MKIYGLLVLSVLLLMSLSFASANDVGPCPFDDSDYDQVIQINALLGSWNSDVTVSPVIPVDINAGFYSVEFFASDGYPNRVNVDQDYEQFVISFLDGTSEVAITGSSEDLADNVVYAESVKVEDVFVIPQDVDGIQAVHYKASEAPLGANSVNAVCMGIREIEDPCEGADYVFDVDMWVIGEDCYAPDPGHTTDSDVVDMPVSGLFRVEAFVQRSNFMQSQPAEDFSLTINGDSGVEVLDRPGDEPLRFQYAGDFDFEVGENEIIMNSAANCSDGDSTPNSVAVNRVCLFGDEPPMVPEFSFYMGMLTMISALGVFFVVRRD